MSEDVYGPAFEAARAVVERHQPDDPLDQEDFDFLHEIVVAAVAVELKRSARDRAALDLAATGIRELGTKWADITRTAEAEADLSTYWAARRTARDISELLARIEATP